ncbi:MAG: FtsX-like permease family protein [Bdellovibrionales bacterium]
MILFKLAFKDLTNNKVQSLLIVLNIAIGLIGFVTLIHFKGAIETSILSKSKETLGADFGISSRSPLDKATEEIVEGNLPDNFEKTQVLETLSMVSNVEGKSRLVQIKAVENNFPFYGKIQLSSNQEFSNIFVEDSVMVYPEILTQLELEVGGTIKVGKKDFTVAGIVLDDSAAGIDTGMAPRLYLDLNKLAGTDLISAQSLAWHRLLFKTPNTSEDQLVEIKSRLDSNQNFPENVRVFTHRTNSEQTGRLLNYLADYLGLAAVAALFLSAIGVIFLIRSYIGERIKVIATMQSLGFQQRDCFYVFLIQVVLLGMVSGWITLGFSYGLLRALIDITNNLVASPLYINYGVGFVMYCLLTAVTIAFLISLPILFQLYGIRPAMVFTESHRGSLRSNGWSRLFFALNILIFWAGSIFISNSIQVGSYFIAGFLGSAVVFALLFYGVLFIAWKIIGGSSLIFRHAALNLVRRPIPTLASFISLSLGLLLINLIPQLETSLQSEMQSPETSKLPSLFMFDIQEEQIESLENLIKSKNAPLHQVSPMVRARLMEVNDKPFERAAEEGFTREQQRENRFRNRGFNLSYREQLSESETLVSGKPFSGVFSGNPDDLAEISIEQRFADRLDLEIGDTLTFDIQSIPIKGKIINKRSVKWTSFQPNFFILFQPGVLEPAPKTFLASIGAVEFNLKESLQSSIVELMPNVSIIDVTRLVSRLVDITKQMSLALKAMAGMSLLVGFLVMYSVISHQLRERKWDINLLKAIGANFSFIRGSVLVEYLTISIIASLFGSALSIFASYVASSILFEGIWVFNLTVPLATFVVVNALTFLVGITTTNRYLSRPIDLN